MRYLPAPEEDKQSTLDLIRTGMGVRAALAELGYDARAAARWAEKDPEYAEALEEARITGIGALEAKLDKRIAKKLEQEGDLPGAETNLIMFRMKNMDPAYRESSPGVHIHAKVEYHELDAIEVRKVLEEAGAFGVIDGEATELPENSGKELPRADVLPSQGDS